MATRLSPVFTTSFVCAADSHPGELRENNEDRFCCDVERGILAVIDGVGGHLGGETAAEIALRVISKRLSRATGDPEARIREAITHANNQIYKQSNATPELSGMACVLTVVLVENGSMTVGHVGDTRLYEIAGRKIEKITRDHSPVGEREDAGLITEKEAMRHPQRNEVFRDVGSEEHQPEDSGFIQLIQRQLTPGSALLLCSDGLSDLLTSVEILSIVEHYDEDPSQVVRHLIEAANAAGGKDNITVVYARVGNDLEAACVAEPMTGVESLSDVDSGVRAGSPSSSFLRSRPRWLYFLYGALAVIAVFGVWRLWLANRSSKVAEQPIIRAPQTLIVNSRDKNAFNSITEALSHASPGDTVEVARGEYVEFLTLRDGVSVISREFRQAIIKVPASTVTGAQVAVTASGIDHARFVGFLVMGDQQHPLDVGMRLVNANVEVTDNEIVGTRFAGMDISDPKGGALLRANLIRQNDAVGIYIRDGSPILFHNLIMSSQRPDSYALKIEKGTKPLLIDNTILGGPTDSGLSREEEQQLKEQNIVLDKPPTKFRY